MSATTTKRINRQPFVYLALLAAVIVALALAGCSRSVAAEVDSPTARVEPTPTLQATELEGVACPAGVVNDPYPGHCKRYVDANNNGLCDLSELGSGDIEAKVRIQ